MDTVNCNRTIVHLASCEDCLMKVRKIILESSAANAGSTRSKKKAKASRENGKLGGRPRVRK